MLFMANAYARHINGDVLERAIFEYDYVVAVDLPEGARTLAAGAALSDTRDPCFYARRHGRRLYMGYEEMAETSPEIMRAVAPRTLDEGKRVFPALTDMDECDIRSAWSGRVYFTLDDYPFVERRHGGRVITFAAPSDHGNALALRIGQLVGNVASQAIRFFFFLRVPRPVTYCSLEILVLSGGEIGAVVIVDTVARFLQGLSERKNRSCGIHSQILQRWNRWSSTRTTRGPQNFRVGHTRTVS